MDNEITEVGQQPSPPGPVVVQAGSILGNYRLDALIGAGPLSEVYAAENLVARKPCAVKVFRQVVPTSAVAYGRYVHELNQVVRIDHPNIAVVFTSARSEGQAYTVMEHVEGTDLRRLLREKAPLSRRVILPVMRGICQALSEIHAFGLSHGHLHPGQIIVQWRDHDLHVKLLDFGTRHLLPSFTDPPAGWSWRPEHAICIAPEQTKGLPGDNRSDVYALAVILYEMATGKVPFLADSFTATLEQHVADQPVSPGQLVSLPAELEETILRGLEKDPRKRIPSVEALLAALDPMAVTGQHQRRLKTTGRYQALSSQELTIPVRPEEQPVEMAQIRPTIPREAPPPIPTAEPHLDELHLRVPRSRGRIWLFVLLGVVALGCGLAITFTLLGQSERPAKKPKRPMLRPRPPVPPRPRAARTPRRPPAVKAPRVTPRAAPERSPAPKAAVGRREALAPISRRVVRRDLGRLERFKGFGAIEINTPDPSAEVYVNGKYKGKGRVVTLTDLPAKTYRIHLVIKGRKTPHRDVALEPKQRLKLRF